MINKQHNILKIYITHIYNRNVAIKIEIYRQLTKVFARSRHFLNAFFAHCTIRVVFLCICTNQPITLDIFRKSRSLTVTKYYQFCPILCNNERWRERGKCWVTKSTELIQGCKENIVTLLQGGKSFGEVACLLEIPKNTVNSVWKNFRIHCWK